MIRIDYTDAAPIYEQIVSRYKNLIVKGALVPNEKLPSVRTLAMELSINPNTIQKAYGELERQGFCYTVKGKGIFVAENKKLKDIKRREILEKLSVIAKEAEESGIELSVLIGWLEERKNREGGKWA